MGTTPDIISPEQPSSNSAIGKSTPDLKTFRFRAFGRENHPPIIDVNKVVDANLTMGAKISDAVASTVGSWRFIIIQSIFLVAWISVNIIFKGLWDPYPFILLNLALSFQAAYSAPFVMMSQNRQAEKDRLTAENDYKTDVKGEEEVGHILEHLDHQDALTLTIVQSLQTQAERIDQQEQLILELVRKIDAQQQFMRAQHQEILKVLDAASTAAAEPDK